MLLYLLLSWAKKGAIVVTSFSTKTFCYFSGRWESRAEYQWHWGTKILSERFMLLLFLKRFMMSCNPETERWTMLLEERFVGKSLWSGFERPGFCYWFCHLLTMLCVFYFSCLGLTRKFGRNWTKSPPGLPTMTLSVQILALWFCLYDL